MGKRFSSTIPWSTRENACGEQRRLATAAATEEGRRSRYRELLLCPVSETGSRRGNASTTVCPVKAAGDLLRQAPSFIIPASPRLLPLLLFSSSLPFFNFLLSIYICIHCILFITVSLAVLLVLYTLLPLTLSAPHTQLPFYPTTPLPLHPSIPPSPTGHTDFSSIMAPKIGINGFGRIGRIVSSPLQAYRAGSNANRPGLP